ncbi:hypothetical protein HOP61_14640 [Halomonas daqingensis]|uniref:Uncharacterized protein n=1 Tax=Billgrantia desiderata TaxID=52021 RepID=A0AAW4YXZ5_9GAMM|nr:hypothetical protein [Halomonas desiderata]MCE8052533.1 hypothetical protein [Halomonas desiderata]
MDTRILHYVDPGLGPEERWFLLQWSMVFGLDQMLTCTLLELNNRLGLSPQHAKKALASLKVNGYLSCETVRHGRGRPVSSHRVSSRFLWSLEKLEATIPPHQPEIEALCRKAITIRASRKEKTQNLMSGEQRSNILVPATYCLLTVLLAHADTPGIVRGVSYGHLISVTGMTKERLKSQLSKLKKLGVIANHEPGVLRSQEGTSMRSVYFLNLAHPLLMGEDSRGLSVILSSTGRPGNKNFLSGFYDAALVASEVIENAEKIREKIDEITVVDLGLEEHEAQWESMLLKNRYANTYNHLLQNARSLLPPLKFLEPVVDEVLEFHRLGMGSILKAHILSYAVMLLSNHWVEIEHGRGKPSDPIGSMMTAIKRDCSSLVVADDSQDAVDFHTFIYALAHHLAVELYYVLKQVEQQQFDCDFAVAFFSVEPFTHEGNELWKLDVHFRPSDGVMYLNNVLISIRSVNISLPVEFNVLAGGKEN